jgi:hypothetical protein
MSGLWVVAFGLLKDGFVLEGPFATEQEAHDYAERDGQVLLLEPATRNDRVVSLEYIPQPTG